MHFRDSWLINRAARHGLAALALIFLGHSAAAAATPLPLATAFPAADAMGVCPDTPLRLTFTAPPALGHAGRIEIHDAADGRVVDSIDVSSPTAVKTIGGLPNYKYYPVIISGREAAIYPRNGALAYGKSYYVTIDAGVFQAAGAECAALADAAGWKFATRSAPPAAGSTKLTVAADGRGDFCTVQGALDFIPDGNTTPTTIFIRKGTYTEIVFFTNKHALTIRGEDRKQTVIEYANSDRFNNNAGGNPFGSANPNPAGAVRGRGAIYHRGMFMAHRVNDLTIAHLTLRNTTPQGGSQAEAIILNGTPTARAILKDVDLYSYQDTLQINGQAYVENCYIEGDVDFMWGTGPCFFDRCTARSLRSGAFYTQIRNPPTNHGYVYFHCTFDGVQGVNGNYFSRIQPVRFPASEVVLLDCVVGHAVGPVAWQWQGPGDTARAHFWEFNSHTADGQPVDTSLRLAGSRRLQSPDDTDTIAQYSDPTYVLGQGWNPKAATIFSPPAPVTPPPAAGAPEIVVAPVSTLALLGTNPSLTVVARGDGGRLAYQWCKDGHPLPGATQPTYQIEGMKWADAGCYTVDVTHRSGAVTSPAAELTAVAPASAGPAPALPKIPAAQFDVTAFGAVGDGATDNTAALQKAINTALGAGGGVVVIPAAPQPYLSGPIRLGSQLEFRVEHGATLQLLPFSPAPSPPSGYYPRSGGGFAIFITARDAHDIALTGGGTIQGDGDAWWRYFFAHRDAAGPRRPDIIRFNSCERVLVSGLTLLRSPMFHCAMTAVNDLTVFDVTIRAPDGTPNTDGIDPSGRRQLVQNCAVSCGDDNVVLKAGSAFCSDITVADCAFGEGHGMSVGGQSNRGLDGLTVKYCTFDGTTAALRLKADATQGGEVKNVSYSNLTMRNVLYPFVFYSYYRNVGNPGATPITEKISAEKTAVWGGGRARPPGSGGSAAVEVEKVKAWNAAPPNSLASRTLPSWKNITINNLTSTNTKGYSVIWGLPLAGYLVEGLTLRNVRITGGAGCKIFDATDVVFAGDTDVGEVVACNALVLTRQPESARVGTGGRARFSAGIAGGSGAQNTVPAVRWLRDGAPVTDGPQADGAVVSGANTATLTIENAQPAEAGKYAAMAEVALDGFDSAAKSPAPGSIPATVTSAAATLTIGGPSAP